MTFHPRTRDEGTFLMHGFEGQAVVIAPSVNTVIVRMGATKEVVVKWDKERFYRTLFAAIKPAP